MRYAMLGSGMILPAFTAGMLFSASAAEGQTTPPMAQMVQEQGKRSAATLSMPMYQPPKRGAPGGRVGGGTRGDGDDLPTLSVLAPDHVGLTTQEQPILYWYLSKPTTLPVELAVIRSLGVQPLSPLLEKRIPTPAQPGIQAIRLADYGVKLVPGQQYQWFVSLVVKADRRSKDIVTGGFIERAGPPEAIQAKLDQAGKESAAFVYAETGLWYDAVRALSDMIEAAPNNGLLRKQRAALLQQVGLPEIAKHDLKHATAN